MSFRLMCLLFVLAIVPSAAAYEWVKSPHDNNPAVAKIEAVLDEAAKIDFIEVPLADVVNYLSDRHKIPIVIDGKALDTVGLDAVTPITRSLLDISLRSALRLMLADLELTFLIRDEVLMITTVEAANHMTEIRLYDVADLLEENEPADHLGQTILTTLRVGGAAKPAKSPLQVTPFRTTLIVRDTYQGHAEVTRVLASLKQLLAPPVPAEPALPKLPDEAKPGPKEGAGPELP